MTPLLSVRNISKRFAANGRVVQAVSDVSLDIAPGETLGVVGESGCGKSTLGRLMLRLIESSSGTLTFDGVDVTRLQGRPLRRLRADMQIVFQDPFTSLDPKMKVREIVTEPLLNLGLSRGEIAIRIAEALRVVGLPEEAAHRYPHAFSGGQRQRVGIARALAPRPRFLVCDEAVSALDVSVQTQILTLLRDIQRSRGTALAFISHNLGAVRFLCHRIAVLYLGRVVEIGSAAALFGAAAHPYTQALLAAIPRPDEVRRARIPVPAGELPDPAAPPPGCAYHLRCPRADRQCRNSRPALAGTDDHRVACHHPGPLFLE